MEHFWQCFRVVEGLSQMVLRCWERAEHAVGQRCSRWLPALLDRVEFRRVRRKIHDAQSLLVPSAELINEPSVMRGAVIDEEKHAVPASQRELEKPDEVALAFALAERVGEPSQGSRAEHVRADVLVVDENNRVAAAARPAARDDGNQAEGCFVLRGDDETSSSIAAHQSARFFLNAAIVAASARR